MMTSSLTQDSGIHTMSSKKDSAFYDSSSLPHYNNIQASTQLRKSSSDCLPPHNHYLCSDMEQLRVRSCDVMSKYVETRRVTDLDFLKSTSWDNSNKHCEDVTVSHSPHFQRSLDSGGGI